MRSGHPAGQQAELASRRWNETGDLGMKFAGGIFLGSAAALAIGSGAQAADLPVKAKPVEYVRVCSMYGAGFWYVPGTDTCLKIGSYVREQVEWNAGNGGVPLGFCAKGQASARRLTRPPTNPAPHPAPAHISAHAPTPT